MCPQLLFAVILEQYYFSPNADQAHSGPWYWKRDLLKKRKKKKRKVSSPEARRLFPFLYFSFLAFLHSSTHIFSIAKISQTGLVTFPLLSFL